MKLYYSTFMKGISSLFLIQFLVCCFISSTGQPYSQTFIDSNLESGSDSLRNELETLIPDDLHEISGTWAKVMMYENTMKSRNIEYQKGKDYMYNISDLLRIRENMSEIDGQNGNDLSSKLKRIKPILDFTLKKLDSSECGLGDMTYRKKMLQKMMLEILFNIGKQNNEVQLGEGVFLEIDGLVVDQTVSKIGRDFYELFFANWDPPLEARNFAVTIKEMPPRMNRVSISVLINDDEVFSSFLSPKRELIEAYALYAIQMAITFLEEKEDVSRTLEEGDMSGTGIY